ncbi:MAG: hypothetical protein IJX17_05295 [Clostridia bacterium]|nr:hypothetical protein [Clostridia bacterium]
MEEKNVNEETLENTNEEKVEKQDNILKKTGRFFKNAFNDMKESAKAQHEVDKANFQEVKAESKANFEENRGTNTWKKAKAQAKQSWDDAHMTPAERTAKTREEQKKQIEEANERIRLANERYEAAKVNKKK